MKKIKAAIIEIVLGFALFATVLYRSVEKRRLDRECKTKLIQDNHQDSWKLLKPKSR